MSVFSPRPDQTRRYLFQNAKFLSPIVKSFCLQLQNVFVSNWEMYWSHIARLKSRGSREIWRAEGMDFPIPPDNLQSCYIVHFYFFLLCRLCTPEKLSNSIFLNPSKQPPKISRAAISFHQKHVFVKHSLGHRLFKITGL